MSQTEKKSLNNKKQGTDSIDKNTDTQDSSTKKTQSAAKKSGKFFNSLSANRKIFFGFLALALIFAGAIFVRQIAYEGEGDQRDKDKVVFSIEDTEYTYGDIEDYLATLMLREYLTEEEAISEVKTVLVYHEAAAEYNIEVTDEDVEQQIDELEGYNAEFVEQNEWLTLHVEYLVIVDQVEQMRLTEAKEGYAFVYYFASLVNQYGDQMIPEAPERLPGENDPELIAEDREYARSVAEDHKRRLSEGLAEPAAIYQEIMQDDRLHEPYNAIPSEEDALTVQFGQDQIVNWRDEVNLASLIEFIEGYSEANTPSDIEVHANNYFESDETYDAYYYFIYLTESDDNFTKINNMLQRNGVLHDV